MWSQMLIIHKACLSTIANILSSETISKVQNISITVSVLYYACMIVISTVHQVLHFWQKCAITLTVSTLTELTFQIGIDFL